MEYAKKILKIFISIVLCQMAGFVGSIFTTSSVNTWYPTLNKPFFNPPSWLFAPVWTLLFALMGVSLYLVWEKGILKKNVRKAVFIFFIQLILNVFWSILFFGLQSPFYAFIEIIILWIAIFFTIMKFYRISKPAAYLLIPYILWVSFAAVLNFSIYVLN
jgi:tryptophan-rich sensory protein